MADTSPSYLRGFILPHKITSDNIWAAQSSYTQGDNQSGDPEPQQNSRLIVRAAGSQNAASDLQIISRRAGHVKRGAAFTWKNNTLAGDEMGQDPPNSISEFEYIGFSDGTGLTERYYNPYPLDLGDGSILISAQIFTTASQRQIRVYKRALDGTYTSTNIKTWDPTVTGTLTEDSHPILIKTPDGNILCIFAFEDTEQELINVSVYRSLDNGANFSEVSRTALEATLSTNSSTGYTLKRIRGAALGGQIILFFETTYNGSGTSINRLHQYCSIDGGGNFKKVTPENKLDSHSFYQIDCYVRNEEFILTYIASLNRAHYMPIPQAYHSAHLLRDASAYNTITTETIAGGTAGNMTSGQMTSWTDDNGDIFALFEDSNGEYLWCRYSEDGQLFRFMGGDFSSSMATVYDVNDTATFPDNIKCISAFGRAILCSNWDATSTLDASATITHLGGWGSINNPVMVTGKQNLVWNRAGFSFSYMPVDLPANVTAFTVAGAATQTLLAAGLKVATSTVQTINYTINTAAAISTSGPVRITGRIVLTTNAKGDITAPFTGGKREIILETSNTTNSYEVSIRISNTQYLVYDINGTAQIGSIQSIAGSSGIELLYAIDGDNFAIWHKQITTGNSKAWIAGPTSTTLTDGGATAAAAKMIFAHSVSPGSGTLETTIREWLGGYSTVPASAGTAPGISGQGLGIGFSSPAGLAAAPYPPNGTYKYIAEGLKITTALGPAFEGDEYKIQTKYGFPIENIIYNVAPSPRLFWRSVAVTSGPVAAQFIPIALDAASQASNQKIGNNLMGIHLGNINFKTFNIEYYNTGAAAWANLKTIDVSEGLTFNYIAANASIIGDGGGTNEPYIMQNECEGWTAEITHTGTGTVQRLKILSNSAGKCGAAANYKRPVFQLDGVAGNDGVCRLIPNNITVLINQKAIGSTAWGIRIASQETIDKYIKIGQLIIGQVVTGESYSWGRSITLDHNIATYETPDRIQYSREISRPRRTIQIAWTEGVDISTIMGDSPTPDIWTGTSSAGAEPIATPKDIPMLILGVYDYLSGPLNPVVYLPSIKRATSAPQDIILLNRYHEHALCVMNDNVSIENVLGDELVSDGGEVFRVSNINLVEVI